LLNSDGIREKDGKLLQFRLVSQSLTEYASIVQKLQESWSEIGVQIDAVLQPEQDIQSGAIARHDYDMLLYGISIGPDPDVFAYWHSSQADLQQQTRLNLSEYSSKTADESLEAGRTREGNDLRRAKYEPFLEAWQSDAPAIALYQPRFLYVVQGTFEGYRSGQFSNGVDRFYSVANWMIRNEKNIKQ
jgi:peptide/nickel transport system substrate-binding protein